MENLSYIGLSRQVTLHSLMEMTANNLANMNTPGFKAQSMLFTEHLSRSSSSGDFMSQVKTHGGYRDTSQGSMKQTFNDLDVAIQGEGYFKVKTLDGTQYTRAGSFSLNTNREIITSSGNLVLGGGDSPITIPQDAMRIVISTDGAISSEEGEIGKFSIVTFANLQNVLPAGNNLFKVINDKEKPVENPHIEQGMLESSNVQPILEMNRMIEIQRLFQATQTMLMQDHERQRSLIQKLTRV